MNKMHTIPIIRQAVDRTALRACIRRIQDGNLLVLFPEGTRTTDGNLQEAKPGVGLIAKALPDCPIVPVYIRGSFRAFPRKAWFPKPVKITIFFGDPFTIDKIHPEEDKRDPRFLSRRIMEEIKKVQDAAGS